MLEDTLLGLLVKNATEMPDDVAMREKRYGVWSPTTWGEMLEHVQRFALGIRSMGFEAGDKMAIIGDNKPQWVIAEFACMAAGGIPTGAYPDSLAEEMEYLITFSDGQGRVLQETFPISLQGGTMTVLVPKAVGDSFVKLNVSGFESDPVSLKPCKTKSS